MIPYISCTAFVILFVYSSNALDFKYNREKNLHFNSLRDHAFNPESFHSSYSNSSITPVSLQEDSAFSNDLGTKKPHHRRLQHRMPRRKRIEGAPSSNLIIKRFQTCNITRTKPGWPTYTLQVHPHTKTVYVHIFKSGGTSMGHIFSSNGGYVITIYNNKNVTEVKFAMAAVMHDPEMFRVSIVREPIARVLSAYHEIMVRKHCRIVKDHLHCNPKAAKLHHINELRKILIGMENKSGQWNDAHLFPQAAFLADQYGKKFDMDYIGRLEDMEAEVRFLLNVPNLTVEKFHRLNDEVSAFRIDKNKLPSDVLKLIHKIYHDDFCCFGYNVSLC